jgi:4-methyl-5(b-hydroxyethyl)-thiazole monophosphate biosynthesis
MNAPRVLIPLAAGCEEMEAVILIDVLRRAGWTVVAAGLTAGPLKASRGVVITADTELDNVRDESFDLVLLPGGGPGTEALGSDPRVLNLCRDQVKAGRPVGAICAAARVLDLAGLLENKIYTCYPGVEARIRSGRRVDQPVVQDGLIHTSQGPGTAFAFALHLVTTLDSPEKGRAAGQGNDSCLIGGHDPPAVSPPEATSLFPPEGLTYRPGRVSRRALFDWRTL